MRLGELERRAGSGAPEDQAAWLVERVRLGRLAQRYVEIAAHCGHAGARLVVESADRPEPTPRWARRLAALGDAQLTVVALEALARGLLDHASRLQLTEAQRDRRNVLGLLHGAVLAWKANPGTPRAGGVVRALALVDHARGPRWAFRQVDRIFGGLEHVLRSAVDAITSDGRGDQARFLADGLGAASDQARRGLYPEALVLPPLCAAGVAWALHPVVPGP